MLKIMDTEDKILVKIADKRWNSSETVWSEVQKSYKKYLDVWKNLPDWLNDVPARRSKVRDNRSFMSMEAVINKVTARPTKPNIVPANETDESKMVATDLQDYFLEKYDDLNLKKSIKKGLRYLFVSKLIVVKIFWDPEIDNYNVKPVDSRKVRFSPNATKEEESEFAIEEIDDETILRVLEKFPEKENVILKNSGLTKESALTENPKITYREMWIGDGVCWIYRNEVLGKRQNPYFDFAGLKLTSPENKSLMKYSGKRRRGRMNVMKTKQIGRGLEGDETDYEEYFYNYFNRPRKPYIFGTVLEVEDKPIGETCLLEQVDPLQVGVDKRKRQIDDNADYVNGITKVDTDYTQITLADARKIHYDPQGLAYGPGVRDGVTREVGQGLPPMVFNDLEHSIREIDNIFGTMETFRGEGGKTETATGRAILREESYSRMVELVDLVDYISREIYRWMFQMMKAKYTEMQYWKCIGAERAGRLLDFIQDDFETGIDIKIIPGQVLPEDRIYRAERASEDFRAGVLDPVTYFETAGGYDNPMETAKRYVMFKQNPFSILEMTDEDIQKLIQANAILQQTTPQPPPTPEQQSAEVQPAIDQRNRIKEMMGSEDFQKLPDEKKLQVIKKLKETLGKSQVGR